MNLLTTSPQQAKSYYTAVIRLKYTTTATYDGDVRRRRRRATYDGDVRRTTATYDGDGDVRRRRTTATYDGDVRRRRATATTRTTPYIEDRWEQNLLQANVFHVTQLQCKITAGRIQQSTRRLTTHRHLHYNNSVNDSLKYNEYFTVKIAPL